MIPRPVIHRNYLPLKISVTGPLVWVLFFDRFVPWGWWSIVFFTILSIVFIGTLVVAWHEKPVHPDQLPKADR